MKSLIAILTLTLALNAGLFAQCSGGVCKFPSKTKTEAKAKADVKKDAAKCCSTQKAKCAKAGKSCSAQKAKCAKAGKCLGQGKCCCQGKGAGKEKCCKTEAKKAKGCGGAKTKDNSKK